MRTGTENLLQKFQLSVLNSSRENSHFYQGVKDGLTDGRTHKVNCRVALLLKTCIIYDFKALKHKFILPFPEYLLLKSYKKKH